jgi:hypothetical protein
MNMTKKWSSKIALLALGLTLSACGKEAVRSYDSVSSLQSPGVVGIPTKVDILFAQDDTGSMKEAYHSVIHAQLPIFLDTLENSGWDYRFNIIPTSLKENFPLTEALVSQYDTNWYQENDPNRPWKSPFPGSNPLNPLLGIHPDLFRTPEQYRGAFHFSQLTNTANAGEEGLEMIARALDSQEYQENFFRRDAITVVIVLSNGDDTSGVTYCRRASDGWTGPCEMLGKEGTYESSYMDYRNSFDRYRQENEKIFRAYSAVSHYNTSECLGGRAKKGTRYVWLSQDFDGESYDLCARPVASILQSLVKDLGETKLRLKTRYLVVKSKPDLSTVKVIRYLDGNRDKAEVVSQDDANGWSYVGYHEDKATVVYPALLNESTGYFFQLNGSAMLEGKDSAIVEYRPEGF